MSDNIRTSLRFTAVRDTVETIVTKLADYFDSKGTSNLIANPAESLSRSALFRPIADTPRKYQKPEWLETDAIVIEERSDLALAAKQFENFAIHTTFHLGSRTFSGSIYFYTVRPSTDDPHLQSFVRLSLHSALTMALRGTSDFGLGVTIDAGIKSSLLEMMFGNISGVIDGKGFVYSLEHKESDPVTLLQLESFVLRPERANPLFGAYVIGLHKSLVSRSALIHIWG